MTDPAPAPPANSNPLGGIIANIFGGGHKSDDNNNIETCTDIEFLISQAQADLQCIERGELGDEPAEQNAAADTDETKEANEKADKQHPNIVDASRLSGGSTDFGMHSPAKQGTEEAEEKDDTSEANIETTAPAPAPAPAPTPPPQQQVIQSNSYTIPELSPKEEHLASCMARIKFLILDEHNDFGKKRAPSSDASSSAANTPPHAAALMYALTKHPDFVPQFLVNLLRGKIPFEARKDFAFLVCFMLVCGLHDDGMMAGGTSTSTSVGADGIDETYRFYKDLSANMEQYVLENYDPIMDPVVRGHDVVGAGPLSVPNSPTEGASQGEGAGRRAAPSKPIQKSTPDVALHCGAILRAVIRHPKLFRLFLSDDNVPRYVLPFLDKYVHQPNFEVQGDALESMKFFFTGGINPVAPPPPPRQGGSGSANDEESANTGDIASEFLQRQYDLIVEDRLNHKLLSPKASYVAKRASIQLLSTVLLTRSNYAVMMKYVASRHNLRTIMLLLRDPSGHITFDAFHVFKIFVANPQKTREVTRILVDNRIKLIKYLDGLHKDRESSDIQFRDEKKLVISTLEGLELDA